MVMISPGIAELTADRLDPLNDPADRFLLKLERMFLLWIAENLRIFNSNGILLTLTIAHLTINKS